MTTNMRVELLKKSNSDLQHDITKAKERVEELEPLEDENFELHEENTQLRNRLEKFEEENARLRDINDTIRRSNDELIESRAELTAMAAQNAALWQKQESALDEAVEYIVSLESDKTLLSSELEKLKERVVALETSSSTSLHVDGTSRCPSRIQSIDESRPSTSHFDSDYYSQTESPRVKPSSASIISFTPSERSKKFLDSAEDHRRSARDLVKRMSAASLQAMSIKSPSPPPTVPEIPRAFQKQTQPHSESGNMTTIPRTPGRYRKGRQLVSPSLLDEVHMSPTRRTSTSRVGGLRRSYRPEGPARSTSSNDYAPPSAQTSDPKHSSKTGSRQLSVAEVSLRVPSRGSSKHAHTNSSSEHVQRQDVHLRRQSESDMRSANEMPTTAIATGSTSSEWGSKSHTPSVSVMSEGDLTSEVDPREERERWWRNVDTVNLPRGAASYQRDSRPAQQTPSTTVERGPILNFSRAGEKHSKTTPNTPSKERDFLFNGAEDVETFMQKTKAKINNIRRPP